MRSIYGDVVVFCLKRRRVDLGTAGGVVGPGDKV